MLIAAMTIEQERFNFWHVLLVGLFSITFVVLIVMVIPLMKYGKSLTRGTIINLLWTFRAV
jgi:hypothetical protein